MGTRSVVAEPQGDGWHGRYVHWDGYPSGVGRTVFEHVRMYDADKVRSLLLHSHTGWSVVAGADLTLEPGFGAPNPHPQCYCHGERNEEGWWIDSTGDDSGTEWAYVIGPRGLTIMERRFGQPGEDNGHGVGMFGLGASDTEAGGYWAHVTYLPYNRAGTDETWDMLDNGIYVPTEVTS